MIFLHKHFIELSGMVLGFIYSVFGMLNGSILTQGEWHAMKIALLSGIAGGIGALIVKAAVVLVKKVTNCIKVFFSGRRKRR